MELNSLSGRLQKFYENITLFLKLFAAAGAGVNAFVMIKYN